MQLSHPANVITIVALVFVALLFVFAVYEVVQNERRLLAEHKIQPPTPSKPQEAPMALSADDNEVLSDIQSLISSKNAVTAAQVDKIASLQSSLDASNSLLTAVQAELNRTQAALDQKTSDHSELLTKVQALIGPELPTPAGTSSVDDNASATLAGVASGGGADTLTA